MKELSFFGYGSIEICYAIVDFEEIVEGEREGAGHGRLWSGTGLPFSVKLFVGHAEYGGKGRELEGFEGEENQRMLNNGSEEKVVAGSMLVGNSA